MKLTEVERPQSLNILPPDRCMVVFSGLDLLFANRDKTSVLNFGTDHTSGFSASEKLNAERLRASNTNRKSARPLSICAFLLLRVCLFSVFLFRKQSRLLFYKDLKTIRSSGTLKKNRSSFLVLPSTSNCNKFLFPS